MRNQRERHQETSSNSESSSSSSGEDYQPEPNNPTVVDYYENSMVPRPLNRGSNIPVAGSYWGGSETLVAVPSAPPPGYGE